MAPFMAPLGAACGGQRGWVPAFRQILACMFVSVISSCTSASDFTQRPSSLYRGLQKPSDPTPEEAAASQAAAEDARRAEQEYLALRGDEIRAQFTAALAGPGFDDIRDIWTRCDAVGKHDDFETTAEFEGRKEAFCSTVFFLDMHDIPRGSGATVLNAQLHRAAEERTRQVKYDMDRRVLLVRLANVGLFHQIALFEETTTTHYTGCNAFGVTIDVDRLTGKSYMVEFLNQNQLVPKGNRVPANDFDEDWYVDVPMEPEVAKKRMLGVRIAVAVTVDSDASHRVDLLRQDATISSPYDTSLLLHKLKCRIEALIAYDADTGALFHVCVAPKKPRS